MSEITAILTRWSQGDQHALQELMPLVYDELKRLAVGYLRRERADHTLQPTALVHEVYMRLAGLHAMGFNNRIHFYGAAARAMRRILVDLARQRNAARRGDGQPPLHLDDALDEQSTGDARIDLIDLDRALTRLAAFAPTRAQVVELRYFGGLSIEETAQLLGVAPVTVKRHWAFARAWLLRSLQGDEASS